MSRFDKTFPTLDCAACILTPKMVSVGKHPNIRLMTWSEIEEVRGYIGNFNVKVRKKARYVDPALCNSCGSCYEACPSSPYPEYRRLVLGKQVIKEGKALEIPSDRMAERERRLAVPAEVQPELEAVSTPAKGSSND